MKDESEPDRACFYAQRQEIIKQKCGGPVAFGVKDFFEVGAPKADAVFDFFLCHEHRKWWNRYRQSVSHWCPMPIAERVK